MRYLLFAMLLLASGVYAQAAPKYNCTIGCTFATDAYSSTGAMPTTCKLYAGGVLKMSAAVVSVSGGVRCQFVAAFPAGTYSLTATAVDAAGQESPASAPFVFESLLPPAALPAPINLRII